MERFRHALLLARFLHMHREFRKPAHDYAIFRRLHLGPFEWSEKRLGEVAREADGWLRHDAGLPVGPSDEEVGAA